MMQRRTVIKGTVASLVPTIGWCCKPAASAAEPDRGMRARPNSPEWPTAAQWEQLNRNTGGRLIKIRSPLTVCSDAPESAACGEVFRELKNPYYIGDDPALTQTTGWVDAWTLQPGVYAVAAETARDVSAAVNFARDRNLRLVVRGAGHSYLGTSNAPDFSVDLDPPNERHHPARWLYARWLRRRASGRFCRSRCDLDAHLRRGHDQRRPICPGRRLRHRRGRRIGTGRRLWQLLQEPWNCRRVPAGGRDRHRGRRGAARQAKISSGLATWPRRDTFYRASN